MPTNRSSNLAVLGLSLSNYCCRTHKSPKRCCPNAIEQNYCLWIYIAYALVHVLDRGCEPTSRHTPNWAQGHVGDGVVVQSMRPFEPHNIVIPQSRRLQVGVSKISTRCRCDVLVPTIPVYITYPEQSGMKSNHSPCHVKCLSLRISATRIPSQWISTWTPGLIRQRLVNNLVA